jgi:hypothetical protein
VGWIERGWRWCRRNPAVASLLGAVAATLVLGATVAGFFAVKARLRADEAEHARQAEKRAWEEAAQAAGEAERQRQDADLRRHELEKQKQRGEAMEALEDISIEDSRATQTLLLLLQRQDGDPRAGDIVAKIQLVQTLGRVAFADSPKARKAALDNWRLLADSLKKADWFPTFLAEHAQDLSRITGEQSAGSAKRGGLLRVSYDLRDSIKKSELTPLQAMLPHWLDQAEKAAEKLTAAAQEGKRLDEVAFYSNRFWRLYCCELVLVEHEAVSNAMVDFGRLLTRWEEGGGGQAPEDVRDSLRTALENLRTACRQERKLKR